MTRRILLILTLLCLLAHGAALAAMYKWVDKNGRIVYSDSPPPADRRATAQEVEKRGVTTVPAGEPAKPNPFAYLDKAADAKAAPTVVLYTTTWCGVCDRAKAFLRSRNIVFVEYDVDKDKAAAGRMRQLNPRGGVPTALINDQVLIGFSEAGYAKALGL